MKRDWYAVISAVLLVCLTVSAWSAPAVIYARVACPQAAGSTLYLSFENNKMRTAASPAALATAAPQRAKNGSIDSQGNDQFFQWYEFAPIDLPAIPGADKATAAFSYNRSRYRPSPKAALEDYTGVHGTVTLTRKDSQGVTWGYVLNVAGDAGRTKLGRDAEHPLAMSVPALSSAKLTFDIVTKVEGREARIGMQAKAGKIDVANILKEGKGAPATLEVTDREGKVVKSENGDPTKFGFT